MRYVALLRGINVGGNSIVKMADLRLWFEKAGYQNVRTYINSGNVLFETNSSDKYELEVAIENMLQAACGFLPRTMVRSAVDIDRVVAEVPKSWLSDTDQKFNVIFLSKSVDSSTILDELDPKQGIETLVYRPGVLYWSAQTSNLTKSNMIKLSQKPLYKEVTVRNLNTVRKIHELLQARRN